MKKSYYITRWTILFAVVLVTGALCVLINSVQLWKYSHPYNLKDLSMDKVTSGDFVKCDIDRYLIKYIGDKKEQYVGVMETDITFFKDYDVYNVPVGDNRYIRVMVGEREALRKLETFEKGVGETVSFMGKVITNEAPDSSWYDGAEDIGCDDIIQNLCIKQVNGLTYKNMIAAGIALALISVFMIYRTSVVFVDEKIDKGEYKWLK